jgi:zeta-carotene desaturase
VTESSQPTVAIVGGGLAGLAAGCALSDSGFRVTLFERRPFLGGRASSYEHPGTGEVVDNCQHVLFGCCTNLVAFYKTIHIENKISWFDRMTFIEPGGRQSILEPSALPPPLHIMPSLFGFKFLNLADKLSIARAAGALIATTQSDKGNFHEWLKDHRQSTLAIERFWKPIMISALSEDLDRIAVPYAAQIVRESMKSAEARRMGIPTAPLTELYNAASDYITSHGGNVRFRNGVQSVVPAERNVSLKLQDSEEEFDYAVLAVPFDALAKLLPVSEDSQDLRKKIAEFETSPITGVHFWFDRPITDLPHAVLLDRTIQWMFNKSRLLRKSGSNAEAGLVSQATSNSETNAAQTGTTGQGYDDKPTESRRDGTNSETYPSYIELVISASKSLVEKSRQEIIDLALTELREFFPRAQDAKLVKATVIKELNATFSPTPGIDQNRPPQTTPWPRVLLAGDWTATGWPATMEGAVRSGYLAAEQVAKKKFIVEDLPAKGLLAAYGIK